LLGSITERVTGRITAESYIVAWQVTGLVAEKDAPWVSHFWETCSVSKLLGDGVLRQVTRQVAGTVAPDPESYSPVNESLGKSLGESLFMSSRSVTKLLHMVYKQCTHSKRERKEPISWANNGVQFTDSYTACSIILSVTPVYLLCMYIEHGLLVF
jgi:hypothetical protein